MGRVRISRVRMKAGGADVRVLRTNTSDGLLPAHARAWLSDVLGKSRPPDAYAAVAFWFDPKTPGRPGYNATWCTEIDAIPAPVLLRMAGPYLQDTYAAHVGSSEAIEALGGTPIDWTPDNAS